jgi:hypothetical protein
MRGCRVWAVAQQQQTGEAEGGAQTCVRAETREQVTATGGYEDAGERAYAAAARR